MTNVGDARRSGIARFFSPILAGATLRDRMIACLGTIIGITLTALVCRILIGSSEGLPFIVAPLGASAVLLFSVPTSPLAQPWPIIGGNMISAMVGLLVVHTIEEPALAMGIGVALAIAIMSFARCLHPPGGAAALTVILGGSAVTSTGFLFPFVPVGVNSILLVMLGIVFHKLTRRAYPHKPAGAVSTHQTADPPANQRIGFRPEDVDAALADMDQTFDIDRGDLDALLRQVELKALIRAQKNLTCADIMSRDVVSIGPSDSTDHARAVLLEHNIRTLPVTDVQGALLGIVGLRELARPASQVLDVLSSPAIAHAEAPAFSLLPTLTDGRTHAVVVVDVQGTVIGLITQTDLLAAAARSIANH